MDLGLQQVSQKAKVDVFDCVVRLGGNLYHEVNRKDVTAPELKILRAIHGTDGVPQVKRTRTVEIDELEECYRLTRIYGRKVVEATLKVDLTEYETWLTMTQEQEEADRDRDAKARQERFNRDKREKAVAAMGEAIRSVSGPAPAPDPDTEVAPEPAKA
jgi:hypothetical protein